VMNILTKKTIRTVTLLIAVVILVLSFSVYVNVAASSGKSVEATLNVASGDPSVLEGLSFNIWSNLKSDSYFWSARSDSLNIVNAMRNTVSFDETGQPGIKNYTQAYAGADLEKYLFGDFTYNTYSETLELSKELELSIGYWNSFWDYPYPTIPGFKIEDGIQNVMQYDVCWVDWDYRCYLIDANVYFTIKADDIYQVINSAYYRSESWETAEGIYVDDYYLDPEPWDFSLTSGIFRTDGKTVKNILPIEISNGSTTEIHSLVYIPKSKCLALSVSEYDGNNYNYYVYVYHPDTDVTEKQFVTALSSWEQPGLIVNDNLLTVILGKTTTCFRTDKTEESTIQNRVTLNFYTDIPGYYSYIYHGYQIICFLPADELLCVIDCYRGTWDSIFDGYQVNINVFNESDLVFSGDMIIWQKEHPVLITISDELPFVTEAGQLVRRYVDIYK